MKLISPELVVIGLDASDKWDAIQKMAELLSKSDNVGSLKDLHEAMVKREHTMSTGLGHGVAIPHAICDSVKAIVVAAATLSHPLEFESLDMQPVTVIFSIASPIDRDKTYMQILAQIARLFADSSFGKKLAAAKSPQEFLKIIAATE